MTLRRIAGRHRWPKRLAPLVAVLLIVVAANVPTTTRVGIDHEQHVITIPLWSKTAEFLYRDAQLRGLTARVVATERDPEARAMRVLAWVHEHIELMPKGRPVIDDHVWNIAVRGYGDPDQLADLFATLATYAGMPGALHFSIRPDGARPHALAIVELSGAKRAFDPSAGIALRTRTGALPSLDELLADPSLVDHLPPPPDGRGWGYREILTHLQLAPWRTGADQIPLSRLGNEVRRLLRSP